MAKPFLASSSVGEHLIRGAFGLIALIGAFVLIGPLGVAALLLIPVAGVAWKGCPGCWMVGLAQTKEGTVCRSGRCA